MIRHEGDIRLHVHSDRARKCSQAARPVLARVPLNIGPS